MWGHDFRPDYFFLTRALEELGDPPTLAITATATAEMAHQIGMRALPLVHSDPHFGRSGRTFSIPSRSTAYWI